MKKPLSFLVVLSLCVSLLLPLGALAEKTEEPYEMTIWMPFLHSAFMSSYDEVKCVQEIAAKTNVKVKFVHPPVGQETEAFNVMVASGDYPDAIYYRWSDYPGGLTKAIQDGLLISLTPYEEQLPNLMAMFKEYPEIDVQARLDDKTLPWMPAAANDLRRRAFAGTLVRQDWLDKLNLKMPTTVDEFKAMLVAFKTGDPNGNGQADEIGLVDDKTAAFIKSLSTAWGIRDKWMIDPATGKVTYGPIQSAFKDYLKTMNEWYAQGLIDPEFASVDSKMRDAKISSSTAGVFYGNTATFEKFVKLIVGEVPEVDWEGMPYLLGPAGVDYAYDENRVRLVWGQGVGVTTGCKNVEAVLRFLDYAYSKEGYDYYGWGIEGESYTKENGVYTLTEAITNSPDGLPTTSAIVRYAFGNNGFAKVHNFDFWKATELNNKAAVDANELWFTADNTLLLPLLNLTETESKKLAAIMNEVDTYFNENFFRFIMGTESLDNFDKFVSTIKQMGIDDAIAIQQGAYERYLSKKN